MSTDQLTAVFAALADPTRRAILERLIAGEVSVKVLAEPFKMSLPAISKHLKILERSGLIVRGRNAQWRPCKLDTQPMATASHWLENYREHWEQSFDRLDDYLRKLQTDQPHTMNQTPNQPTDPITDRELVITRVFDAPRALVYEVWTTQAHAEKWFTPNNCTQLESRADVRLGGEWVFAIKVPGGDIHRAIGIYTEIVPNERLVFTHAWEGDDGKPEHWTLITVEFADHDGERTQITFKQAAFRSVESRNNHNKGWSESLDHLGEYLAKLTAGA